MSQDSSFHDNETSASDVVFHGILNGLEAHRFVPGQRLAELDLAALFKVGRNSVREALQRLAAEGIVQIFRHKGAAIRTLSERETLDVLEVAERLTGLLACTAARAGATPGQQRRLGESLEMLELAAAAKSSDDFAQGRREFYRALLDIADSRELKRLFRLIHMPIVHAQHRLPTLQALRLRDYRIIAQSVLQGDAAGADAAAMEHVRRVREEILRAQATVERNMA